MPVPRCSALERGLARTSRIRRSGAVLAGFQAQQRSYHFASPSYVSSFGEYPPVDVKSLRSNTVKYLEDFDSKAWFDDPVCTLIQGHAVNQGESCDTVDAFGKINGKQILATSEVVDRVLDHVQNLDLGRDFRAEIRRIDERLLSQHAAFLIGNQAMDFHKQDGVTEIEESIEANVVERKLNDLLLQDELAGRVRIQRQTALVGCVSNFSNFLDLCRKTLRNIELGIPVLVLSRSNTTQHMYRWVQLLLVDEMKKEGLDTSLVSYVSCSIEEQRRIMSMMKASPLYLTGSREVAAAIKELMPYTFASTGGPNTMVAPKLDGDIEAATRMSSTIENSGQCTAMRHLVTDSMTKEDLKRIFQDVQVTDSSAESLRKGAFDGLFRQWAEGFQVKDGYEVLPSAPGGQPLAYRISRGLTPNGVEEHWRRVYLDVSTPTDTSVKDPKFLGDLSRWLTTEQPITLAVNGDDEGFPIMHQLFQSTAQAIYSVGREGKPALTAQARPQDGEIFGEFPPRLDMGKYTCGPVFVPSSTPSYMARYEKSFLEEAAKRAQSFGLADILGDVPVEMKGYAVLLAEYLKESCGAKHGFGNRTTLWGLQRPPLREVSTFLRVRAEDDLATVLLHLLPFILTNAKEGLVMSIATDCSARTKEALRTACQDVPCHEEDDGSFQQRCQSCEPWNVVVASSVASIEELPLVDHFVLRLLPMGHIKSACQNDKDFVAAFEKSPKWLKFTA